MSTLAINEPDHPLDGEPVPPSVSSTSPMLPRDTDLIVLDLESLTKDGFMMYALICSLRLRPTLRS